MKREKYRYDQWPQDGIAGVSADEAVELAISEKLGAYAFLTGQVNVTWLIKATGEKLEEDASGKAVLLFAKDVESAAYGGEVIVGGFRAYRSVIEQSSERIDPSYISPNFTYEISKPLPVMKREDLVFYTADIEAIGLNGREAISAPQTVSDEKKVREISNNTPAHILGTQQSADIEMLALKVNSDTKAVEGAHPFQLPNIPDDLAKAMCVYGNEFYLSNGALPSEDQLHQLCLDDKDHFGVQQHEASGRAGFVNSESKSIYPEKKNFKLRIKRYLKNSSI